jgi:hypothetical protein
MAYKRIVKLTFSCAYKIYLRHDCHVSLCIALEIKWNTRFLLNVDCTRYEIYGTGFNVIPIFSRVRWIKTASREWNLYLKITICFYNKTEWRKNLLCKWSSILSYTRLTGTTLDLRRHTHKLHSSLLRHCLNSTWTEPAKILFFCYLSLCFLRDNDHFTTSLA